MKQNITSNKKILLTLNNPDHLDRICSISKALSAPDRIRILQELTQNPKNLSELSLALGIPLSSVSRHIDALVEAGLIIINYYPARKGHTKSCALAVPGYSVMFPGPAHRKATENVESFEMPVGMFSEFNVAAPCGMAGKDGTIGAVDSPLQFLSPERAKAQCIWFASGYLCYMFPPIWEQNKKCTELSFTFEVCSETTYFNNFWKSDITISVNDIELLTFTSPGDFGGRRGRYTPEYWDISSTQFGLLKKVSVRGSGVYLDNALVNKDITVESLRLSSSRPIKLTIAVKENAKYCGGINLFGENFGDYPQAIVMTAKNQ